MLFQDSAYLRHGGCNRTQSRWRINCRIGRCNNTGFECPDWWNKFLLKQRWRQGRPLWWRSCDWSYRESRRCCHKRERRCKGQHYAPHRHHSRNEAMKVTGTCTVNLIRTKWSQAFRSSGRWSNTAAAYKISCSFKTLEPVSSVLCHPVLVPWRYKVWYVQRSTFNANMSFGWCHVLSVIMTSLRIQDSSNKYSMQYNVLLCRIYCRFRNWLTSHKKNGWTYR